MSHTKFMTISARSGFMLVASSDPTHVGAHLRAAAAADKLDCDVYDVRSAFDGNLIAQKLSWWFRGHTPIRLRAFSDEVVRACRLSRPKCLLATGIAPLDERALRDIGNLGIQRLNFLTDDPWNPALRAPWFLRGLAQYDVVFTPRRANQRDLTAHGCKKVFYLPFGYAPEIHYAEQPAEHALLSQFRSDVSFVGGADRDRVPYISALLSNSFRVSLHGGYWNRYASTRPHARGYATPEMMRQIAAGSHVSLCLVRRANRDGHCMRSFELAAMGACILAEKTDEHLQIFGIEGESVLYFTSIGEMITKVKWLLEHPKESAQLRRAAVHMITENSHTYRDRLRTMLGLASIS